MNVSFGRRLALGLLVSGALPYVSAAQTTCTFHIDCDDGNPCTVDVCSRVSGEPVGSGTCSHDPVAAGEQGDCDDGVRCNGAEVCQAGTCVPGTPPDCAASGLVCDENADDPGNPCVTPCGTDAECDDGLTCTGDEACDASSGLCTSMGNPCGHPDAECLEAVCVNPNVPSGTPCQTDSDCGLLGSCSHDGPFCFDGKCCGTGWGSSETYAACTANGDNWYPNTLPNPGRCPLYASGIAAGRILTPAVGPVSASPANHPLAGQPLRKIGDDYDTGGTDYIQLDYLRFVGGVTHAENNRVVFEFYDEQRRFVSRLMFGFASATRDTRGDDNTQSVPMPPGGVVPPRGIIMAYVDPGFADDPSIPGELFWYATDQAQTGNNDPNKLYVASGIDDPPTEVSNFLKACTGGLRAGRPCADSGDCAGGTCDTVPGILAFELEGYPAWYTSVQACCNTTAGTCTHELPWVCESQGGTPLGYGSGCDACDAAFDDDACRTCVGGAFDEAPCFADADCQGGVCTADEDQCRRCLGGEDKWRRCTDDTDCPGGTCGGACVAITVCETGACCLQDGTCELGHDEASCGISSGEFQGNGTDCGPNCCTQPTFTGSDNCETVTVHQISVPQVGICEAWAPNAGAPCVTANDCGGHTCERTTSVTITGDNTAASNTAAKPDSCGPALAEWGDLGWYEAFEIDDCAYVTVDHCCTEPLKLPGYRPLYESCPCGEPILPFWNIYWGLPAPPYGYPYCDEYNEYFLFRPLAAGTYYYPIYSEPGSGFGEYQLHLFVSACPDAACCVGDDCQILDEVECDGLGGVFLGYPNQTRLTTSCGVGNATCTAGSCCVGPGECVDNQDATQQSQVDVDRTWCDAEGGDYIGGMRCLGGLCEEGAHDGQACTSTDDCAPDGVCAVHGWYIALRPEVCPSCEIEGQHNCQHFGGSWNSRPSDLAFPGGGVHVADDFVPLQDRIDTICVWGAYNESSGPPDYSNLGFCTEPFVDNFRVRVYGSDSSGLPDSGNLIGEATVFPPDVTRVNVPIYGIDDRPAFAYQLQLGTQAITGLDASGNTCYWLEVTNTLDGSCFWGWSAAGLPANDFSASGSGGRYGPSSARSGDMAFCLNTAFDPRGCGPRTGYCCACDGTCTERSRAVCLEDGGRWRIDDTCATAVCEPVPPANDLCVDVNDSEVAIAVDGSNRFDNTCAWADGVSPVNTEIGTISWIGSDVWFKYISTCEGIVTISTCATGPASAGGVDTVIAAYKDPDDPTSCICPADADAQDAAVGWYSDPVADDGTTIHAGDENCSGILDVGGGYISGAACSGECVMIRVAGFGGPEWLGPGTLTITCEAPYTYPDPLTEIPGNLASRYIVFEASPGVSYPCDPDPGPAEAVRVTPVVLNGVPVVDSDVLYIGPPVPRPEEDTSRPGLTFNAAPLQCALYFVDWSTFGVVAAYGAEIIPDSEYMLQRASIGCPDLADEACWSEPLTIRTGTFADVIAPFDGDGPPQPDFNDIAAVVRKFQADPTAPSKVYAQLVPNVVFPDRPVDFKDIAASVAAFVGTPFVELSVITGPCACPSSVVCGTAACTSDTHCPGGYCIDGFCTDACGRCGP